ncbi:MAG TPA: sigma-70 family RNA polymerase sigma factor [Anaerolineales bacterium]|nr:sigma-70 family RNA polymerase sigma factor [Anaerolineales bacterium]
MADNQADIDIVTYSSAASNPAEFDKIYQTFVQPVFRYLLSRVQNRDEAEELTAQTFLAALERLPGYRHNGHFPAWLFSIVRNKAADHFRRLHRRPEVALADTVPAEQVASDHRLPELAALLDKLPTNEQELLRLRFVAELSFAEIAALQGRNLDAVKKSTYRLLDRLHAQLEPDHE